MGRIEDDIRKQTFSRVYLFYGAEDYLKTYYKNQLKRALVQDDDSINLNVWKGKDVDVPTLREQAMTMPFFASHRLVIVEESGLFKQGGTELAEALPQLPEETVIVFVEAEVDRRSKLFTVVKSMGYPLECKRMSEERLTDWIITYLKRQGRQIQRSAMKLFRERVGNEMDNVMREMEKLVSYTHGRDAILLEDVQALTTVRTESRVFDLVDAIALRRQTFALEMYHDLLSMKEAPIRILILIGKQFDRILQIRELRDQGLDSAAIAERTGMQDFRVRSCLRQGAAFTAEELRELLFACVQTDENIKSGRMNDALAVELLIISACGAAKEVR